MVDAQPGHDGREIRARGADVGVPGLTRPDPRVLDDIRASYGGIVVMMAAGTLARRSDALRRVSLRVRTAFGLAVVFLMIAKPDAMVSLVVLGLALGVSTLVALPIGLTQPSGLSSTGA